MGVVRGGREGWGENEGKEGRTAQGRERGKEGSSPVAFVLYRVCRSQSAEAGDRVEKYTGIGRDGLSAAPPSIIVSPKGRT